MTTPISTDEDDPSGPQPQTPSNPSLSQPSTTGDGTTGDGNATTSAPPASKAPGPNGGVNRRRASTIKQPPTLLSDFLLGRPSPARIAAEKQAARERRKSLEMVKKEMRQAAIQRIQAPGGVRDRVKKWQRANAEAMASADPLAPPTEPSEINIQVDEESVTEQDRERIKWRQKKAAQPQTAAANQKQGEGSTGQDNKEKPKPAGPPKKRVVSDTNWVKNAKNKSPATQSQPPKPKQNGGNGTPIPKDFLQRTAANPSVSKKVQAWASKVELPSDPLPKRYSTPRSFGSADGIRSKATANGSDTKSSKSDSTYIAVEEKTKRSQKAKEPQDDGIRVRPVSKNTYDDGIRIKPMASEAESGSVNSDSTHVVTKEETKKSQKGKEPEDDGIRVRPLRTKAQHDDEIRNRPRESLLSDDGIRVYPSSQGSRSTSTLRAPARKPSAGANARVTSSRKNLRDSSPSTRTEVPEGPEHEAPATPTKRPSRRSSNKRRPVQMKSTPRKVSGRRTVATGTTGTGTTVTGTTQTRPEATEATQTGTTAPEDVSDSQSWTSSSEDESDRAPTALPSQLADIPVGYSAFSVLDLSTSAKRQNSRRPKASRQTSFKGATNVLKKVLTEGKKMVSEKVDSPKPVANQPPSIEKWLKGTVDPFVEGSSKPEAEPHHRRSIEKEWAEESKTRQSTPPSSRSKATESKATESKPATPTTEKSQEPVQPEGPKKVEDEETRKEEKEVTTPSSAGLRRSRATRVSSSPLRPSNKKGLKDKIRDAFRGESTGHSYMPPPEYPSCSTVVDLDDDLDDEYRDPRQSFDAERGLPFSDDEDSTVFSEPHDLKPPPLNPKRRPPTNGQYELSTIISEQSQSTQESDLLSTVSGSTVTQTTAFTKSTKAGTSVSRHKSHKSGLKRRLTKHSDLVSALSLTDNDAASNGGNNLRSTRSVRRATNNLDNATVENLLREFAADENLYQRELKTLVDGVVPVLLTQVVYGEGHASKDLFGSPSAKPRQEMLSKAVVDMGVALEKLRNSHKRCPLLDAHRLPQWLESVHMIYDRYLDVWRLGFQGVIVNLAPATFDDNDSLINAMPRNEAGDVLNEDGERIDVAHLLKRPLVRIKWITKFIKGYRSVTATDSYETLASRWEKLQEKARKRYREETARVVDDDATYTDTSRTRDLHTLEALDHVKIDRHRQVYAKDTFSLDLRHSSGQRLVCQIELISRDDPVFKSDHGDLLIREIGNGGRSWLLFAPIAGGYYSAREGDDAYQLVVMIRGDGDRDEWFELLTLAADDKEQILDWLEILGSDPVPPSVKKGISGPPQVSAPSPRSPTLDVPLGERRPRQQHASTTSPLGIFEDPQTQPRTPARYHTRVTSLPVTSTANSPPAASSPSLEPTPTQDSYLESRPPVPSYPPPFIPPPTSAPPVIPPPTSAPPVVPAPTSPPPAPPAQVKDEERSHPLHEDMRPEPLTLRKTSSPNSTPFRDDGAPPPPVHRTFSQKSPTLAPPTEKSSTRLKRRTSSPLKHEYHPSDVSTDASSSPSDTDDDYENYENYDQNDDDSVTVDSSDDELEAADIPDTVPAISVKPHLERPHPSSLVSESLDSLTPSASASQAGFPKADNKTPEYVLKSLASISYWDNKHGCWKDLWPDTCTIVTTPGLIEAYPYQRMHPSSSGSPQREDRPLIALDLTPLVMLRNSTALDLEIRSPVLSYARLYSKITKIDTSFFRFRAPSLHDCENLYLAVHRARMDNAKYKALEEETRIRSFGQQQPVADDGDGSSHRRGWFGRKNSYRASARAPSQSAGSISHSSTMSASSFLKRLMGGHQSFNIAMSSIDRQSSRPGSVGGDPSFYGSSSSSSPRSPSVSAAQSGGAGSGGAQRLPLTTNNLKIRLHMLVSASKWEDHGNCLLEVARPDVGARQNLRKYQGMEKRVIVRTINKRHPEKEKVVLDVVLGSRCFSRLGSRGVLLNVWEEGGVAGSGDVDSPPLVSDRGNAGGQVSKWCFQCASVAEATWIYGLVTQEVMIG